MKKVTLKLQDFYNLEVELNGLINQETGQIISKALLSEKIKLTTKYWLNDLVKKIIAEKESVENLRQDLVKKYGDDDGNGGISVPKYINIVRNEEGQIISRDINPKFEQFQKEFNNLLEEERELEYKPFKLEEFDNVESEGVYNTFFKLVEVGE